MSKEKLSLRVLKGQDTFTILRLLSKLGVKDLVMEIFGNAQVEVTEDLEELASKRGANLIAVLVEALTEKLPEVQDELNAFLADLAETDLDTILDLDFDEYLDLVMDFLQKEELVGFIKRLSSFTGMGN